MLTIAFVMLGLALFGFSSVADNFRLPLGIGLAIGALIALGFIAYSAYIAAFEAMFGICFMLITFDESYAPQNGNQGLLVFITVVEFIVFIIGIIHIRAGWRAFSSKRYNAAKRKREAEEEFPPYNF